MWLCGKKIHLVSVDTLQRMINSINELQQAGITVYSDSVPPHTLMDTSYSNNHLFYCETFGGLHYFLSQDAKNFGGITSIEGCDHQISFIERTERGGYEHFQRNFPFEFRPPALTTDSLIFNVPAGTYIKKPIFNTNALFTMSVLLPRLGKLPI